ncbi:HAD-IIB family hydrolase [Lactiplantibacillus plantarum]|nr:HAD-IIB family hydrolase [Lactiplantibacillus plantarum]MDO1603010.1 HAD-IIB family hydrolase [Lactiplantibacillus plantarum]
MERKLIALDLDGTTLNAESKLNSATIQTMQRLQAAGHIVSIITGRSYQGSQAIYDQLRLKSPMINLKRFSGPFTSPNMGLRISVHDQQSDCLSTR